MATKCIKIENNITNPQNDSVVSDVVGVISQIDAQEDLNNAGGKICYLTLKWFMSEGDIGKECINSWLDKSHTDNLKYSKMVVNLTEDEFDTNPLGEILYTKIESMLEDSATYNHGTVSKINKS